MRRKKGVWTAEEPLSTYPRFLVLLTSVVDPVHFFGSGFEIRILLRNVSDV